MKRVAAGGEDTPFTTTTTCTDSGTPRVFRGWAGVSTLICVFPLAVTDPSIPPKKTFTPVPLPRRTPWIVTVSPPAHEPLVGRNDVTTGPVSGTPWNCRSFCARAQS